MQYVHNKSGEWWSTLIQNEGQDSFPQGDGKETVETQMVYKNVHQLTLKF